MDRRTLRDMAFKMLFEADFKTDERAVDFYAETLEANGYDDDEFLRNIFFGVCDNKEALDAQIEKNAKGWKLSRISRVSLVIMRIAIYEMLFAEDIPFAASINEAIELAKKYDDDNAPKFVNGILNTVAHSNGLKDIK